MNGSVFVSDTSAGNTTVIDPNTLATPIPCCPTVTNPNKAGSEYYIQSTNASGTALETAAGVTIIGANVVLNSTGRFSRRRIKQQPVQVSTPVLTSSAAVSSWVSDAVAVTVTGTNTVANNGTYFLQDTFAPASSTTAISFANLSKVSGQNLVYYASGAQAAISLASISNTVTNSGAAAFVAGDSITGSLANVTGANEIVLASTNAGSIGTAGTAVDFSAPNFSASAAGGIVNIKDNFAGTSNLVNPNNNPNIIPCCPVISSPNTSSGSSTINTPNGPLNIAANLTSNNGTVSLTSPSSVSVANNQSVQGQACIDYNSVAYPWDK